MKSERADDFRSQIEKDAEKIASINEEAKLMLVEAEARLQMIEAAATRGSNLADSELALKKLSARSETLPIALEEARMTDEIKRELENELAGLFECLKVVVDLEDLAHHGVGQLLEFGLGDAADGVERGDGHD